MPEDRILLIDPFKNFLTTYRMILEEEKYLVETASSLREAYLLFETKRYAVIVTENILPFEATCGMIQSIKKNSPESYIIILTNAIVDEKTYEKLFDMGVDDFILKPYSPERILVHIRKGLRQRDFVLKSMQLEAQNILDPMTHQISELIFGHAYFKKCLKQELKKASRHRHGLSLLLVEIPDKQKLGDQFKSFCGALATILRRSTREEDMVGRHNGNFGILLPHTDHNGSKALVERLSNLIQAYPSFESDKLLSSIAHALSFQSFTYPDAFALPKPLDDVVGEIHSGH